MNWDNDWTIHKYKLEITNYQIITASLNARPKHVGIDNEGTPCIWIETNPTIGQKEYTIFVVGTGHPVPPAKYVGSFNQDPFIWHIHYR